MMNFSLIGAARQEIQPRSVQLLTNWSFSQQEVRKGEDLLPVHPRAVRAQKSILAHSHTHCASGSLADGTLKIGYQPL